MCLNIRRREGTMTGLQAFSCQHSLSICLTVFVCLGWLLSCVQSRSIHDYRHADTPGADVTQFFVSTSGSDSASGDADHPFRTITRAQTAVQSLKQGNGGHVPPPGVVVSVASGSYDFSNSPFELTKNDSGDANAPVVYKGAPGTTLSGGRSIPTSLWKHFKTVSSNPDTVKSAIRHKKFNFKEYMQHRSHASNQRSLVEEDPGVSFSPSWPSGTKSSPPRRVVKRQADVPLINIMKVDLKTLNITNYGDLGSGQLADCANNKLEVVFGGKSLVLARHPNIASDGKFQFLNIANVLNISAEFQFKDTVLSGVKDSSSMWLHGYWGFDWADNYVRVVKLDGATSTITTDSKTLPLYGYHKKARFYALNALEFLDSPGEYYLDRSTGILYFALPAGALEDDMLMVSIAPSVVSMTNVSYVSLDGLDVKYSRSLAVVGHNLMNVTFSNAVCSNHGGTAVLMYGSYTLVHNITAYGLGCGGIVVEGGDLASLTRGESAIEHCTVYDYCRWKRTYMAGIGFGGVGNYFRYNSVSGGPHTAFFGAGNDLLFEYNNISNMCYESTDTGAFYTGRSWIRRGNVIRNNIFSHIRATEPTALGYPSVQAIYLDDQMSGFEIYNNTFIDCQKGTFVGGGRRNLVYNNYYEDCDDAVHLDNRGLNWMKSWCQKNGPFFKEMESVHYDKPPWSTHYPNLLTIFSQYPCYPAFTSFTNNTYCRCKSFADVSATAAQSWHAVVKDNIEKCR